MKTSSTREESKGILLDREEAKRRLESRSSVKYACSSFSFEKRKSYFVGDRNSPSANADLPRKTYASLSQAHVDLKSAPGCDVEGKDSGPLFVSLSPYNPFQNGDMAPLLDLLGYFEK